MVIAIVPPRCPCGADDYALVFRYERPPAGEVRFQFSTAVGYQREVLRCAGCGHFVSRHQMDDTSLYTGDYVSATYPDGGISRAFDRITGLPAEQSDNTGRVRRLLDFASLRLEGPARRGRPPRVLDVGSGLCVFLHRMKAAGWEGTALDRDPRLVAHARDVVGVQAVCGDILTAQGLGRYEVVTFNKVLEHLRDPVLTLAHSRQHLEAWGFTYVEVPDGEMAVTEGPEREEFFIDHHHVFSLVSLKLMAARAGFLVLTVERLREPSRKFTLRAFLASAVDTGTEPT